MPSYTLEIEAFGVYTTNMPSLEIWEDGVLDSTHLISSLGSSIFVTINYPGALPSSLSFVFNDGFAANSRTIEIQSVKINDRYVNTSNYLSSDSLVKSATATVDVASSDYIFDISADPDPTEFTTGATRAFTAGIDSYRDMTGSTDQVFDMLGSADYAYLGAGNDKVSGGAGNDILRGNAGNDLLFGDDGNDRLFGGDGIDTLHGGIGNDRLYGNAGDDEMHGGDGDDRLVGGADNDILTGGIGADILSGNAGNDFLYGDGDNDQLVGGAGDDTMDGGDGDDLMYGGAGADIMDGGDGVDTLIGGLGADVMNGNDGVDTLYGQADDDEMHGGVGDDILYGGDGIDTINGDADNDILNGGDGVDTLNGGTGVDVLVGGSGADTLDGGTGNDTLHGHGLDEAEIRAVLLANPNLVWNAETNSFYQFVATSVTAGVAEAAANAIVINGTAGHLANVTSAVENTYVTSFFVNPWSWVGGDDAAAEGEFFFRAGAEDGIQFWSGVGGAGGAATNNMYTNFSTNEPSDWGVGEDYNTIQLNGEWDDANQGASLEYMIEWDAGLMLSDNAIDIISGGDGDDMIYGYGGDDVLNGDADNDILIGGAGADALNGGTGNDALFGGAGSDAIDGGDGDDTIDTNIAVATTTLISEDFSTNTGVFTYSDGGFGGSDSANVDVIGTRDTSDGNTATGSLEVYVDGLNNSSFTNGSGTWDTSVSNASAMTDVQITFSYRHWHSTRNDTGEDSEVYFEFNGVTYDASGGSSYLSQALGSAGETDTGWITVTIDLPDMAASTVYNLSLGILHGGSSRNDEDAYVRFDDVTMTGTDTSLDDLGSTNTVDGGAGDDTIYGSSGTDIVTGGTGNDTMDGGYGADTAIFSGNWADYTISLSNGIYTLFHISTGDTDTATQFENFQFDDGTKTTATVLNSKPTITSNGGSDTATISIAENTTAVTTVIATDVETPGSLTYSISGGRDASSFSITAGGVLTFLSAPDYEMPTDGSVDSAYDVEVSVTDGGGAVDTQNISVQVTDVAEGDVGNTTGTAGTITVGSSVLYDVDSANDRDWFAVTLTGGTKYAVWARGDFSDAGTDTDPRIYTVYQSDGTTVESAGDDDGGMSLESLLYFTPGSTGTYYIDVGAWDVTTGTNTLSVFEGGSTITGSGTLNGGAYADYLDAGTGNDTLNGGGGSDILNGDDGDDILDGGAGADVLFGGAGADTFMITATDSTDSIVDFDASLGDVLDISSILVGFDVGVDDINDFLQFQIAGIDNIIRVDVDGLINGTNFAEVAIFEGDTGDVVQTLYDNGDIIV